MPTLVCPSTRALSKTTTSLAFFSLSFSFSLLCPTPVPGDPRRASRLGRLRSCRCRGLRTQDARHPKFSSQQQNHPVVPSPPRKDKSPSSSSSFLAHSFPILHTNNSIQPRLETLGPAAGWNQEHISFLSSIFIPIPSFFNNFIHHPAPFSLIILLPP
ncbi:hypothetical protein BT67DRAFT_49536 [Trichocladium antarcticum]|uniref:Uncharacterized protein n=1 Tax=Trichocladium antarcticum TaxID=1450529 RepID=A0AAN6UIJ4_9PEZI|nr:hypothetical protein BT67DRAFT_49536 [Trichocladium antarcticum]